MLPSRDGSEEAFWAGSPGKGLKLFVVLSALTVDGGLQINNRAKAPTLEPPPCGR